MTAPFFRDALLAHPAAIETSLPDEHYIKLYEDYSIGVGTAACRRAGRAALSTFPSRS